MSLRLPPPVDRVKWLTLEAPFFGWINQQGYLVDFVRGEKPGKLTFSEAEGSLRLPADRDVLDLRLHGARPAPECEWAHFRRSATQKMRMQTRRRVHDRAQPCRA